MEAIRGLLSSSVGQILAILDANIATPLQQMQPTHLSPLDVSAKGKKALLLTRLRKATGASSIRQTIPVEVQGDDAMDLDDDEARDEDEADALEDNNDNEDDDDDDDNGDDNNDNADNSAVVNDDNSVGAGVNEHVDEDDGTEFADQHEIDSNMDMEDEDYRG